MVWTLRTPVDLGQWRSHCRLVHGTWMSPLTPIEQYWEFHQLDHDSPGEGCIPHQHKDADAEEPDDHGFW